MEPDIKRTAIRSVEDRIQWALMLVHAKDYFGLQYQKNKKRKGINICTNFYLKMYQDICQMHERRFTLRNDLTIEADIAAFFIFTKYMKNSLRSELSIEADIYVTVVFLIEYNFYQRLN